MTIGIGVWAFVVYILAILVWMLVIKRNIAEAMLVGLVVISLFNGPANILTTLWNAVYSASKESSFLATMLFLLMAVVMTKTGIIAKLVELLNSIIASGAVPPMCRCAPASCSAWSPATQSQTAPLWAPSPCPG